MKINLYFFNFSVLTSIAILGCGKKNNINPQLEISTSKSYFVANKYTQFSNLYSFDYKTNTTTLLLSRPASDDAVVFEKFNNMDNFQGIYFVERFSPNKNSRVTFYSVNRGIALIA